MDKLADKYPGLGAAAGPAATPNPMIANYENALLRANEMAVQYEVLTNQVARFKVRQLAIEMEEGPLLDLQRESDRDRQSWDTFKNRENDAQLNAIIESGNSQISVIEKPTPPVLGDRAKVNKITLGILLGGLGLAFGLPCLIEFVLDQSLKRPSDIQSRLGVPYFIGMPMLKTKSKGFLKAKNKEIVEKKVPLLPETAGEVPVMETAAPPSAPTPTPAPVNGEIAAWDERHALRPFFETLRDRLMTYFEMINLTHKPKLVAVTSCGEGSGVTTTAAGLASALSETGEGNVLLVNMNAPDGEAHHFYRGKLGCALEEAFEKDKRGAACVQDNLYIAKDLPTNENLPRVLPKRFSHLVPKMRASDYDYIIFDMPPMSQISITPRLARYMDMVLMVIESGKTDRDVAKRATNLLLESKTNVGVVLNKSRDYLPRSLQHDL
jgi:Mrp family chromosome partitioning ATPase